MSVFKEKLWVHSNISITMQDYKDFTSLILLLNIFYA